MVVGRVLGLEREADLNDEGLDLGARIDGAQRNVSDLASPRLALLGSLVPLGVDLIQRPFSTSFRSARWLGQRMSELASELAGESNDAHGTFDLVAHVLCARDIWGREGLEWSGRHRGKVM